MTRQLICDLNSALERISILETKVFNIEQNCCSDSADCIPISIISQPSLITLDEGETLNISVQVKGTPPYTFQWSKDTVDISGATSSSLIITDVELSDAGEYILYMTNDCGEVTSTTIVVVVEEICAIPVITASPSTQTVEVGDDVTLTVSVTSSTSLTYQWRRNGVNIFGATSSSLLLENVTTDDQATYTVVVTNECGSVTSNGAILTVDIVFLTYYWGWSNSIDDITNDIEVQGLQESGSFVSGDDLTADFTANTNPQILFMAEPKTEVAKTKWYGSMFNQGTIGDPDTDLFGPTYETSTYRVYATVYQTQQTSTPIQFLKV